jgi:hypothetical protein
LEFYTGEIDEKIFEDYVKKDTLENYVTKEDAVGRKDNAGGEIFGDYKSNQATAKYAIAFGTGSESRGIASFSHGRVVSISNEEWMTNSEGLPYAASTDCLAAILSGEGKYEVITKEALEAIVGYECAETQDGAFAPATNVRSNEAIGSGSMASGMGAVAYSRASKSLGFRT